MGDTQWPGIEILMSRCGWVAISVLGLSLGTNHFSKKTELYVEVTAKDINIFY